MESSKTIRYQSGSRFDIFISYRVAADAKLVESLYDKLSLKEVEENGKVRKLRVFWDKKCLLPGKSWEEGFSKALINSRYECGFSLALWQYVIIISPSLPSYIIGLFSTGWW